MTARPALVSDWVLWQQARSGCASSATRLVRMLGPQALGLATHMLQRREDAEDAVQDAFVRLWRSEARDAGVAKLSTYFNTIVLNRCRTSLARPRDEAIDPAGLTALSDAQQWNELSSATGVAFLTEEHARARLQAGLSRLPARQRMALAMWAYADASVARIASALGIDPNAAHQLLSRAKQSLRADIEGELR